MDAVEEGVKEGLLAPDPAPVAQAVVVPTAGLEVVEVAAAYESKGLVAVEELAARLWTSRPEY